MKLISDRVLVEDIPEPQKTKGGIYMASNPVNSKIGYVQNYRKGKVINIGNGRLAQNGEMIKMEVKVDDIVMYPHLVGKEIEDGGKDYLIMYETDILAILKPQESDGCK